MAHRLTDHFLVGHCYEHLSSMSFLSTSSLDLLGELHAAADGIENGDDFLSRRDLSELWRELLVDAIHALKVRDKRERAYLRGFAVDDIQKMQKARGQNVYGIGELTEYFQSFSDFERVLYSSGSTYRDHVTHVIRVWLIGIYLLTGASCIDDLAIGPQVGRQTSDNSSEDGNQDSPDTNAVTSPERWAMWTVVALCHDLGYPLEQTHRINDVIDNMLAHFGNVAVGRYRYSFQTQHQPLNEMTLRVISSRVQACDPERGTDELEASPSGTYQTVLQTKYYTKFARSLEDFSHGVISCLVLMKTLVCFMETDYGASGGRLTLEDARQFHIRREMLRAIASHTCPEVYHLQINTLSFLLILCDQLQEWGRPTFREMKLGRTGPSEDGYAEVGTCALKDGRFVATVRYIEDGPSAEQIRRKFGLYHKLFRAAIKDDDRRIDFEWHVSIGEERHAFAFKSTREPFEELVYTVNEQDATPALSSYCTRKVRTRHTDDEHAGEEE